MATIVENKTEDIYGITPEMRAKAREKLERLILEQGIKPHKTRDDLYRYSENSGQTQEEIRAEINEFEKMREELREIDRKLENEREL
jgi:hypothetical protein